MNSRYNKVSPRGLRDDMHPADGSSTDGKIAADLRPSADGSAVRTSLVASVPIAQAAAPWDRQTDGSRYSKMPPYGGA